MTCQIINNERDDIIPLMFLSIQQKRSKQENSTASGPNSISPSPFMGLKKDGLPPAVRPVLPPGWPDWTVRNTAGNPIPSITHINTRDPLSRNKLPQPKPPSGHTKPPY
ncbi:hypothetical protein B9Z19DRAFT_1062441 [Tuber borchii]|uniref:Uncharacterized protein n=1 Tax=Tuber borchii TaxID=42251 RepID=A0A2T7A1W9_TUBBO|nr:hypothetical protein B9Z19DRAFT_1062441 [Tuber borchii]